ncbi:MAG TPA: hypothetical protein VIH87_14555 [Methylocella sp.]
MQLPQSSKNTGSESGKGEEQKRAASRRFFGRASFDEIVWKSYPSPNVPRPHVAVRCSDAVSR